MNDGAGMSTADALAFLARQQMRSTAMRLSIAALNEPRLVSQSVTALRDLADAAEADCAGVVLMGAAYASGLRRYADMLETGEEPKDDMPPILTVIKGGLDQA